LDLIKVSRLYSSATCVSKVEKLSECFSK